MKTKNESVRKKRKPLSIAEIMEAWKNCPGKFPSSSRIEMMQITNAIYAKGISSYTTDGNPPYQIDAITLQGTPGPGCTVRTADLFFLPAGGLLAKPTFNSARRQVTIYYPMEDFLAVKAVLESSKNVQCFYVDQPMFQMVTGWIAA